MKIGFEQILERKHIAASFAIPLRLTRLGPDDLRDHKTYLNKMLKESITSGLYRSIAMQMCFERLERSVRWN